jgi:hypothetical protein
MSTNELNKSLMKETKFSMFFIGIIVLILSAGLSIFSLSPTETGVDSNYNCVDNTKCLDKEICENNKCVQPKKLQILYLIPAILLFFFSVILLYRAGIYQKYT